MNELEKLISDRIGKEGPLTFAEFMQMALYHPGLGYYCSDKEKLGFGGDFYTSCTLSRVFGYAVARQLLEMWQRSGITDFTVVEYGAGTGELCAAIMRYFSGLSQLPGRLEYKIIEISPSLREIQRAWLPKEVEWIDDIGVLDGFTGVVLSNELLDNFPVHRVVMKDRLMEVMVDYDKGFRERLVPAGQALQAYFSAMRVSLPAGFHAEVCLLAGKWINSICNAMSKGFVMTIDFGYLSGELYIPERAGGTIVSYSGHKVVGDLYRDVGRQDISAHVNFSALALYGMDNGLQLTGFREQGPFLRAMGFEQMLVADRPGLDPVAEVRRDNAVMQTLLGDMGKKFKVLVLQKDLPSVKLTGFQVS